MPSAIDLAKRSLVGLLKRLSTFYVIVLQLNRDASEADVRAAFRNVSRKAHPDRGGRGLRRRASRKPERAFALSCVKLHVLTAIYLRCAESALSCFYHPPHTVHLSYYVSRAMSSEPFFRRLRFRENPASVGIKFLELSKLGDNDDDDDGNTKNKNNNGNQKKSKRTHKNND